MDASMSQESALRYAAAPMYDRDALAAYELFTKQIHQQYLDLPVRHIIVPDDPYTDAGTMFDEITRTHTITTWASEDTHPLWTPAQNDEFRAVHDFHGHYRSGGEFNATGEERAYERHATMFGQLARRALATETRAQFAYVLRNGHFPTQKLVLLPEWVAETPLYY